MSQPALPVLLSIPHGGREQPPELHQRVALDDCELFADIDSYVIEIYDIGAAARQVITTAIARTYIDLNRAPDDLPPHNPDGVIKASTCYRKPVYHQGYAPDAYLSERLLANYYYPYHQQLQEAVKLPGLKLALDCHSMAAIGPPISPDAGQQRPAFCLGNRHHQTCPRPLLESLANALRRSFGLDDAGVALNTPFSGGYITRHYGGRPLPWIQVEMSRALYLEPPWFNAATLTVAPERLRELREKFYQALCIFFGCNPYNP